MSEFIDIIPKAHTPSSAAFGIAGEFPVDWRLTIDSLTVLGQLCDNCWVYDGLFTFVNGIFYVVEKLESPSVWDGNIQNYKSVYYTDESCQTHVTDHTALGTTVYTPKKFWYKPYEIEISGVELATEADKLSHKITINGHESYLSDDDSTIEIGRLYPEEIEWDDIETTTACGMFYGTHDEDKFALLVEKMGNDQYKRTLSIYNGNNSIVQTAYGTATTETSLTWLSQSASIGTITEIEDTTARISIDCAMGTSAEKWCYSAYGISILETAESSRIIETTDGREFTTSDTDAFVHPFLIKLHDNGTADIVSLIANNTRHGQVRLSDSLNDEASGVNSGIAATPRAVALLNAKIGDGIASELKNLKIGTRNLLSNSGVTVSNKDYQVSTYWPWTYLIEGETYTITIRIKPAADVTNIQPYLSDGYKAQCVMSVQGTDEQTLRATFTAHYYTGRTPDDNPDYGILQIYRFPNPTASSGLTTIKWIKVERETVSSDWTPAPEDVDNAISTVQTNLNTHDAKVGGTSTNGHVKLSSSVASTSGEGGGIAATPYAVKQAYDKGVAAQTSATAAQTSATAAQTSADNVQTNLNTHAAVTGNGSTKGHVKLSDSASSSQTSSSGVAATPAAVYNAIYGEQQARNTADTALSNRIAVFEPFNITTGLIQKTNGGQPQKIEKSISASNNMGIASWRVTQDNSNTYILFEMKTAGCYSIIATLASEFNGTIIGSSYPDAARLKNQDCVALVCGSVGATDDTLVGIPEKSSRIYSDANQDRFLVIKIPLKPANYRVHFTITKL